MSREWYAFFSSLVRDVDDGTYSASSGLSLSSANAFSIASNGVTDAMLRDSQGLSVIGRPTSTSGDPVDIVATADDRVLGRFGGVLEFRSLSIVPAVVGDGDKGDIVVSGTGTVYTIDTNVVTFAKMQDITTDRLIGRDTAGTGDPEHITVGGGLEFTGSAGIQTSAFTGDATKAAGGTALTLATVNSNVGTFGSATQASQVTVNAKGLVTAAANVTVTPAASSITGAGALTRTDDTNVTLTLGGTPASALLAATSLTLGWTGQLAVDRGGTGIASYAVGDLIYASGATTLAKLADVATGNALISGGVGVAPAWGKIGLTTHISGTLGAGNGGTGVTSLGDITRVNDTNVTLALGGTPTGSVINGVSFTLGWSGQLAASRGGTGVSALGDITRVNDTNVTLTLGGTPTGALITSTSFTLGWTGTLAVSRGGTGASTAAGARTNLFDGAMVKKAADQTGVDLSGGASITFDTEVYDPSGRFDSGVSTVNLNTLSGDTYVEVGATLTLANVTIGSDVTLIIRRNGSTGYDGTAQIQIDAATTSPALSVRTGPVPVTGGTDNFQMVVFCSDTSVDITATRTNFWIKPVG